MTSSAKKQEFNRVLFRWHKTHYRDMPWRPRSGRRDQGSLDPYKILVSEIMLQQTQVDRVRAKYAEFLKRFPNVETLARAPLGEVLRIWSGLGYNRRAKYLHQCAKHVVQKYDGKFPCAFDELVELPGIGRSTAGALLAFSFGHDVPMIDTNIRRILCRVFFKKKIPSDKELYEFATTLIPKRKGRMWNYAMLDLGATVCTARNHAHDCPLSKLHGRVGDFVYKKPQKKFAGSNRYYRGQVLKLLFVKHSMTSRMIANTIALSIPQTSMLLKELTQEGMIVTKGGRARIV